MNKILLLSPFFYPEPISTGKYNSVLAKELIKENVIVDVVCSHPIYPTWKVSQTDEEIEGVSTYRGGRLLKFPNNVLLRRAVLEMWFLFHVFINLINGKKYDCIIPIFPPSLFMMIVPLLSKKTKILGIVHDLQGVYANNNAGLVKKIIFNCIKSIESKAFNACDQLIFLSEDMRDVACDVYSIDKAKCAIQYPFVTINKFVDKSNLREILPEGNFSLVYSGALGDKQDPEKLAAFMEAFANKHGNVNAYIFSQGPNFERLKKNYKKINFHPLVPEDDLPELLIRSSVQILPQAEGTSDGSLPSKLPNLLASGCKILCITDDGSELVRILNNYTKAEVVTKWDQDKLIGCTEKLLNSKSSSKVADDELLSKFRIENLVALVGGNQHENRSVIWRYRIYRQLFC